VDFVVYKNDQTILPVEVKYQNMPAAKITRGFRSFLEAYRPENAVVITKNLIDSLLIDSSHVHFIPLAMLDRALALVMGL